MADQVRSIIERIKAQQISQKSQAQAKKPEPLIPPLPKEAEEEAEDVLEDEEPQVSAKVEIAKEAEKPKPQHTAQAQVQVTEDEIKELNKRISSLQNNGLFRLELLLVLEDIARKLGGGQ